MTQIQDPQFHPPAPKQRHTLRNVLIVFGVLAVLGIGGVIAIFAAVGHEYEKQANQTHVVVYKVSGTSKAALITYSADGKGTIKQEPSAALPWSLTYDVKGVIPLYQLSAQNAIGQSGSVTCTIEYDGKVVQTESASGQEAARCSYSGG
jgi:hypothetical protein